MDNYNSVQIQIQQLQLIRLHFMFVSACTVDGCLTCNTEAATCDACEPGFVRISTTECRGNSQSHSHTHTHTHKHLPTPPTQI